MDDSAVVTDDDFDAFNDETFGGDGDEYAWEDSQQAIFDSGESYQMPGNGRHGIRSEKCHDHPQENDYEIENDMEESISRLVMDDESESGADIKAQRLATSHAYFMPPQVVNKHLSWFMEKDLPGGSSLLGSSVWSMHPTVIKPPAAALAQKSRVVERDSGSGGRIPPAAQSSIPAATHKVVAPAVGVSRPPPGFPKGTPVVRTLDEIEREQFLESKEREARAQASQPTPLPGNSPRFIDVRELEMNNIENTPPRLDRPAGANVSELSTPVLQSPQSGGFSNRPPPGLTQNPPSLFHPRDNQGFNQMRHHPQAHFQHPHAMHPMFQHPQHLQQMRMHHMNNMRPVFFGPGGYYMMEGPPQHHHPYNNSNNMRMRRNPEPPRPTDPFADLMNSRDKQRLRNIQIIQLQNDHPYKTDYYYQMRFYKTTLSVDYLKRLFPANETSSTRSNYEPTRFENALGKLQAVSALAPKRIIDTNIRSTGSSKGHSTSHRPQLLCEIERLYVIYLDAREVFLRVVAKTAPITERVKWGEKLLNILDRYDSRLMDWMTVRKGRTLLFDIIVYLFEAQHEVEAYSKLAILVKRSPISIWRSTQEHNEDHQLYRKIESMISHARVEQIDQLLQVFSPNLWQSRFGCSIFFKTMERAAVITLHFSGVNETARQAVKCISLNENGPGQRDLNYRPPTILKGFQRIPALIEAFVQAPNEKFGPLLSGKNQINVNVLIEFLERTQVKGAGQRLHSLHSYISQGHEAESMKNVKSTQCIDSFANLDPSILFNVSADP